MVGSQSQIRAYGVWVKMMIGALVVANLGSAWEEAPATEVVYVGGKVLCQDCSQGWNEWVQGGNPIKGCKVAVTCRDDRHRVVYYDWDETDEQGQYEMRIPKMIHGKEMKPKWCSVRLVSSPDEAYNIPTNSGGGKSGVNLTRPTHVYRGLIKFVLSPFYYTTPMCEKPDTNDHDDNQAANNY